MTPGREAKKIKERFPFPISRKIPDIGTRKYKFLDGRRREQKVWKEVIALTVHGFHALGPIALSAIDPDIPLTDKSYLPLVLRNILGVSLSRMGQIEEDLVVAEVEERTKTRPIIPHEQGGEGIF